MAATKGSISGKKMYTLLIKIIGRKIGMSPIKGLNEATYKSSMYVGVYL